MEAEIICTCCSYKFKSKTSSTLRIGDGEIEQRYLNKHEELLYQQRLSIQRTSHPAPHQDFDSYENSKEEYEEEDEEEEDEEEKEVYYNDDNPFEVSEEQKYARNEIQHLNSQIKTLNTVTLLVIEETLLDDFIIKDKKDQEKELSNIGEIKHNYKPAEINAKAEELPSNSQEEQPEFKDNENVNDADEEEKEVNEAENADSEIQGGPEERAAKNSLKSVRFDLLVKQILLPFFQIQTRILQKGNIFEIGSIKFLVAATTPHKLGKIGTKTKIR